MSELGSGGGSSYPGAIDTDASLETASTVARFNVPNDIAAAVIAVQTELGIDPAGSLATLVARLAVTLNDNGTAKNIVEGTLASRPATYTIPTFYFASDIEQMFYYSVAKSKWYTAF